MKTKLLGRASHRPHCVLVTALVISACVACWSDEHEEGGVVLNAAPDLAQADPLESIRSRLDANETVEAIALANELIDRIEHETTRYDPSLVDPLVLLGDGLRKNSEYVEALDTYDRARHIARISHGLHSVEQLSVVYREAETYHELGQIGRATNRQEYAYSIYTRSFEDNSIDRLPGMFSLADWYLEIRNVFAARGIYDDALKITQAQLGRTDPQNIRALRGLALSYRYERFITPTEFELPDDAILQTASPDDKVPKYEASVNKFAPGEEALKELVRIEMEREGKTSESLAYAKLDLADWFLLFHKHQRAALIYRDIWNMFAEDPQAEFLQTEFSEPRALYYPLAKSPEIQPPTYLKEPMEGVIELSFNVTQKGEVTDAKVLSVTPDDRFVDEFLASMLDARYRPVIRNGERESQEGVILTHTYIFFPDIDGVE